MQIIATNPQALANKLDAAPTIATTQICWAETGRKYSVSHLLALEAFEAYSADDIRVRIRAANGLLVQPYADHFPGASSAQLRILWRYIDGFEAGLLAARGVTNNIPTIL